MQVLVTRPAVFEIPKNIKRILLVNRSKGNAWSIIDGVLTGELPGQDKIQSEECMSGLQQTMNSNKNIEITRHTIRLSSDRGSSTSFGNPMEWNAVADLAKQYNADAILVLEYFDTDFTIRDVIGYSISSVFVRGTAKAKAGFRLYDPTKKTILYERTFSYTNTYTESAPNRLLALAKLIKGTDALNEVSFSTGRSFARRLIIYSIWEDRVMFKGKNQIGVGCRYALTNNWEKGVETWLNAYKIEPKEKEKGKIAYNLALGYEVLGKLEDAKNWITTAYVEHQNKKAASYSQIINRRIENEGTLEQQLKK